MASRNTTRRFTPARVEQFLWLVLVGPQCTEHWLEMNIPDEDTARKSLGIKEDVPILIGRP